MKVFMLLTMLISFKAMADDDPYWYGTVDFKKSYNKEEIIEFPVGHPYYPGTQRNYDKKLWSGEVKYFPEGKAVMRARYNAKEGNDRTTEDMKNCAWKDTKTHYSDVEKNDKTTTYASVTAANEDIYMRIEDDGSYRLSTSTPRGIYIDNAVRSEGSRIRQDDCSQTPIPPYQYSNTDSDSMDHVKFVIEGITKPNAVHIEGNNRIVEDDGSIVTVHWDLYRVEPKLLAEIKGPQTIQRLKPITLDATPSKGKITKYTWTFGGDETCPLPFDDSKQWHEKVLTFIPLCNFTAYLDVEDDDGNIDFTRHDVIVTPREGEWKMDFNTKVGPAYTKTVVANAISLGLNQCSLHEDDEQTGHYVHTDAPNNITWKDYGYVLAQLSDNGPFNDMWYVQSETLQVSRLERINSALLPGGELYQLNVKTNKDAIDDLIKSTKAHEAMHSTLMQEKIAMMGPKADPAFKIETLMDPNENVLQFKADLEVREMNSQLETATTDERVKARLKGAGYNKGISIFIKEGGESTNVVKKDLGPQWNIGD